MLQPSNKPSAIIMGVQKCGTTTLYGSLINHSNIKGPTDPANKNSFKEIDFFYSEEKWELSLKWYFSHFVGKSGIFIDASPNYLTTPICYERIFETLPDIKIIICLRDPVARAYSQYNHYWQAMPESLEWDWLVGQNFLNNLQLELKAGFDARQDFTGFLLKGAFIKQIRLLLNFFKRSQIYIAVMDRWHYNYQQEIQNILFFLDQKIEVLPMLNLHKRKYSVEPLDPKAKRILINFYKPLNEELFNFLGYEISEWNY